MISALYDAFEAERELNQGDMRRNIRQTVPLSQTMSERITALRNWARTHARPASIDDGATVPWMEVAGDPTLADGVGASREGDVKLARETDQR